MIEPSGIEQASVMFMGRRSFRMEVGALPIRNELAIPISISEIPTERIFGRDRARILQAASTAAEGARPASAVSNGTMVGFGLMTFALGILLTWTVDRSWGSVPPAPLARAQVLAPAPAPPPAVVVEPIAVTPPPLLPDVPPSGRVVSRKRRRAAAVEAEQPGLAAVAPAPAKPWVDPFAE